MFSSLSYISGISTIFEIAARLVARSAFGDENTGATRSFEVESCKVKDRVGMLPVSFATHVGRCIELCV